jgi:N-acetylglucosamine-6-sulfatase
VLSQTPLLCEYCPDSTAILGKLMNGYSMARYGLPEGWDFFRVPEGAIYSYDQTSIRDERGALTSYAGYRTDVYTGLATNLLQQLGSSQPWFLWLAPGAPVDPDDTAGLTSCSPSPTWRDHDQTVPLPDSPSFNEADVSDKPRHIRQLPLLTTEQQSAIHEAYTQQLECLRSLDTYVATVVSYLATTGQLANTDIIYVSDNGYAYGEHRVSHGKKLPYDYAAHLPLVAAGPDFSHRVDSSPRSSVDLAATILDVTGALPEHVIDGTSIRAAVNASRPILHEGRVVGSNSMRSQIRKYTGIRTPRWLYVHYRYRDGSDDYELYDRTLDPGQTTSVAADPRYQRLDQDLALRLKHLEHCTGSDCP